MSEKILVLCAHSDDQVLGIGATIAKYSEEGKKVYVMIFSNGEMTPFWIKSHLTIRARIKDECFSKIICRFR